MRERSRSHGDRVSLLALAAALFLVPGIAAAQTSAPDQGQKLFEVHCARCHGLDGGGGEGPNLMRENLRRASDREALRQIVDEGIPGTDMPGAWSLNGQEIGAVVDYVLTLGVVARAELPGDPAAGQALYEAAACSACHVVNGEGIAFGPDLSDVGLLRGPGYLRQAIEAPEAAVLPRHRTVRISEAGGADVMGLRVNEDTFSIQILTPAGEHRSYLKREVREIATLPEESLMMSYAGQFNEAELDDLVAYLASLRGRDASMTGEPE